MLEKALVTDFELLILLLDTCFSHSILDSRHILQRMMRKQTNVVIRVSTLTKNVSIAIWSFWGRPFTAANHYYWNAKPSVSDHDCVNGNTIETFGIADSIISKFPPTSRSVRIVISTNPFMVELIE